MVLISVIVPVYNVEIYIEKSLKSILNQTFLEFECIIVNDGTLDSSIEIAKKTISGDDRFRIINKLNGGLSDARNFGLMHAVGDYICFLDSDDYYDSSFLEKMYHSIKKTNSDVAICDVAFVSETGHVNKTHLNDKVSCISGVEAFVNVTISNGLLCTTPDKLFKRSLFEAIKYPLGVYYEDRATTYKLFLASEKITFVNEVLFYYVQREGSITNTLKEKQISDRVLVMDMIREYFETEGLMSKYKDEYLICYLLNVYLSGSSMISKNAGYNLNWFDFLFSISDESKLTFSNILKVRKVSVKKMLALLMLKLNVRFFYFVHNFFIK